MDSLTIIDKHQIIRAGLEVLIKKNFMDVMIKGFDSFHQLKRESLVKKSDLYIVGHTEDWPNDQDRLIMELKIYNPQAKIVFFDDNLDQARLTRYYKAGVTGFIGKLSDTTELLKCINEVRIGKKYISNEILQMLLPNWISSGSDLQ